MAVSKPATTKTLGKDENGALFAGGQSVAGNAITQLMVPDLVNPELGSPLVSISASGAPAFKLKAAPIVTVAHMVAAPISAVSFPCKSVCLLADDGGPLGNSNTDVIWIGSSSVGIGSDGLALRPGGDASFDCDDLADVWAVSATAGQKLTMAVIR